MNKKKIILAISRDWHESMQSNLENSTGAKFTKITAKEKLTYDFLKKINPNFIFFPHWSYIIPEEIYSNFNCVIFHMTDLPYGRGGSPLQNLIARGVYQTKISAIKCVETIDAGPVYLKEELSLHGTAQEIYIRSNKKIEAMIKNIIDTNPVPVEQTGQPVFFKRRTPEESDIGKLKTVEQIFDYIRMLDAPGYPKAFLNTEKFSFKFSNATLKDNRIVADVSITLN